MRPLVAAHLSPMTFIACRDQFPARRLPRIRSDQLELAAAIINPFHAGLTFAGEARVVFRGKVNLVPARSTAFADQVDQLGGFRQPALAPCPFVRRVFQRLRIDMGEVFGQQGDARLKWLKLLRPIGPVARSQF